MRKYLNRFFHDLSLEWYKIYKELQENQFSEYDTVKNLQKEKLSSLLRHSFEIPYYQKCFKSLGIIHHTLEEDNPLDILGKLPILSKDLVKENFQDLCAFDHQKRESYINFTGGSTGVPTKFLLDHNYKEHAQAHKSLAFSWRGVDCFDSVFYIWGAARDMNKGFISSVKNFIRNRYYFNCFSLTEQNIRFCIKKLNARKPALIVAYADAIYEIAKYANEHNLFIEPQQAIHTGAGNLYDFMKEEIVKCFQCKVFNHYGARDAGSIASECVAQDGLHLMQLHHYVEILDDDNKPVSDGKEGKIVVTTLDNYSMPLIRYEIGDRGIKAPYKKCPCGCVFSKLQSLTGRSEDRVITPDSQYIDSNFFIHIIGVECNQTGDIKKFQVVQNKISEIEINIVPKKDVLDDTVKENIKNQIQDRLGSSIKVIINIVQDIAKTPTGKYRYVINHLYDQNKKDFSVISSPK